MSNKDKIYGRHRGCEHSLASRWQRTLKARKMFFGTIILHVISSAGTEDGSPAMSFLSLEGCKKVGIFNLRGGGEIPTSETTGSDKIDELVKRDAIRRDVVELN
jgi:hypothetical protein